MNLNLNAEEQKSVYFTYIIALGVWYFSLPICLVCLFCAEWNDKKCRRQNLISTSFSKAPGPCRP